MKTATKAVFLSVLAISGSTAVQADAFKPSKKDQVSLGDRASKEIRKEEKVVSESDRRVKKLREIAGRLLVAEPLKKDEPWQFSFDLIDKPKEMNAYALPGGPIFFYTGLFDKFTTEDQIAGVLAHEMTHIRKEHWAYAYADQQKRQLGLSVLLILIRANRTTTDLASIGNDLLLSLPFSRKHETEADDIGFRIMEKAGYNPQGMVDSFKILRGDKKGGSVPEWLSTHPDIDKRVTRLQDKVTKSGKAYPAQRTIDYSALMFHL